MRISRALSTLVFAVVVGMRLGNPFVALVNSADAAEAPPSVKPLGSVADLQGIVTLRPPLAERWTPLRRNVSLWSGDRLRTDFSGPNAVRVRLSSGVELTLGPGTQLEFLAPLKARIWTGEVQVNYLAPPPAANDKPANDKTENIAPFELVGPNVNNPGKEPTTLALQSGTKTFHRVIDRAHLLLTLTDPATIPKWLAGFEGTATQESLGSLVVSLPDGRNEPLTIGYHKVHVEIRDQIARTTIEESFVNHPDARLEGIFHFPLPADASISGFGMWIGGELVEADVVEKQRAREIFETILREKRDPALLEWMSGNLFKARVFPIEPHSEKRVTITYTQVLPLANDKFRYRYSLNSDMLKTKPLRELALNVTIASARTIKSVACATHTTQINQTEHAAKVDYSAQAVTPDRDFEVVCELDGMKDDVVVVPHRRGDDGYLLLQLSPPGTVGNWQRNAKQNRPNGADELVPDGDPLTLVLLCDTSGSIDRAKRKQQAEFVATVLSSLGEKDRFLLGAADVDVVWATPEPIAPGNSALITVRDFLEKRVSLGWTNLDRTFEAALAKAPAGAHIVYIGDGIQTSGDRDAPAFVRRLKKLVEARRAANASASGGDQGETMLHAVTIGNVQELVAMQGIAAAGGGSLRAIAGEQSPQVVARELLDEIARPGLRDVKIEFRGVKVAAVYPERLPNLPAGTQQIVVARYLPEGKDQSGEVIITGRRGSGSNSEPVRYTAQVKFADAEAGNAFIPRLWARSHLDHLLAQGATKEIRDSIIRLSEEFHIITPYTSLLVLESDADRERFGVVRRFEMRDGQEFFREGKAKADFDLAAEQAKRAGKRRFDVRRAILGSYAALGRNPNEFQQRNFYPADRYQIPSLDLQSVNEDYEPQNWNSMGGRYMLGVGVNSNAGLLGSIVLDNFGDTDDILMFGKPNFLGDGYDDDWDHRRAPQGSAYYEMPIPGSPYRDEIARHPEMLNEASLATFSSVPRFGRYGEASLGGDYGVPDEQNMLLSSVHGSAEDAGAWGVDGDVLERGDMSGFRTGLGSGDIGGGVAAGYSGARPSARRLQAKDLFGSIRSEAAGENIQNFAFHVGLGRDGGYANSLFPHLEAAPLPGPPPEDVKPVGDPETEKLLGWTPEVAAIVDGLLRVDALAKLSGGLAIEKREESFDPVWDRRTKRSEASALYSPKAWWVQSRLSEQSSFDRVVNYCNEQERGAFIAATRLGLRRASVPAELNPSKLPVPHWTLTSIRDWNRYHKVALERPAAGQVLLSLTENDSTTGPRYRYLIDEKRQVILRSETLYEGKVSTTNEYSDFVEVAGAWWPKKIEKKRPDGRTTQRDTYKYRSYTADEFAAKMKAALAPMAEMTIVKSPRPSLDLAKLRLAQGTATFEDRLAVLQSYHGEADREAALALFAKIEQLDAAGRPSEATKSGLFWLKLRLLAALGRREEAKQLLRAEAERLAAVPHPDEATLALRLLDEQSVGLTVEAWTSLYELLQPIVARRPDDREFAEVLFVRRSRFVPHYGYSDESAAWRKETAERAPWDDGAQSAYAQLLAQNGNVDEALAWLAPAIAERDRRPGAEKMYLRLTYLNILENAGRRDEHLRMATECLEKFPDLQQVCTEYLKALGFGKEPVKAGETALRWLTEARTGDKPTPVQRARLTAALEFVRNRNPYPVPAAEPRPTVIGYYGAPGSMYSNEVDPRWAEPLLETARHFIRHSDGESEPTSTVMGMLPGEARLRLREELFTMLEKEAAVMSPRKVAYLVNATIGYTSNADTLRQGNAQVPTKISRATWKPIVDVLRARWEAMPKPNENWVLDPPGTRNDRLSLTSTLQQLYTMQFNDTELLPFLRRKLELTPTKQQYQVRNEIFNALASRTWTKEHEDELLGLLGTLGNPSQEARAATEIGGLYRFVDAMIAGREQIGFRQLSDQGGLDKLTKKELAAKREEIRRQAREAIADRLGPVDRPTRDAKLPAEWLRMERAWLDIQLKHDSAPIRTFCLATLGTEPWMPLPPPTEKYIAPAKRVEAELKGMLQQRALTTLEYLATRRETKPELAADVLRIFDATLERLTPKAGFATKADAGLVYLWREEKYRFLTALDRVDDLERQLRAWMQDDAPRDALAAAFSAKRLALLRAERGDLDEAIGLLEGAEKQGIVSASEYRRLADWYQAKQRPKDYERALVSSYRRTPEEQLHQMIEQARRRRDEAIKTGGPRTLDEETILAMQALLTMTVQPQRYTGTIGAEYMGTHDVRWFRWVPDAVLGRTSQQVAQFVQQLKTGILGGLWHEVATDTIAKRIAELRAEKPTPTDARALDLLEAVVEWQAAEQLNRPEAHAAASVAGLRRAERPAESPNDAIATASLLRALGKSKHDVLRDEQVKQLRALVAAGKPGSHERLTIAMDLVAVLYETYGREDDALVLFAAELASCYETHGDRLPIQQLERFNAYTNYLCRSKRYLEAEGATLARTARASNRNQKTRLETIRLDIQQSALRGGGSTSLGSGEALFKSLVAEGLKAIDAAKREDDRYQAVNYLVRTYEAALAAKVAGVETEVLSFAFEKMPEILKLQTSHYVQTAQRPINILRSLYPHAHGRLRDRYLIERIEQWPTRLPQYDRFTVIDSQPFDILRTQLPTDPEGKELAARALALAVLQVKEFYGRPTMPPGDYVLNLPYGIAPELRTTLAKAAEDVYQEKKGSGRHVALLGAYYAGQLGLRTRAIEILTIAEREKLLDRAARLQFVQLLRLENMHAKALEVFEPIAKAEPDAMHLRAELLTLYFHTGSTEKLNTEVAAIDEHFHSGGRWTTGNIFQFAQACGQVGLPVKAIGYHREAIAEARRATAEPNRDRNIADWHDSIARLETTLGHTYEAVDAALGSAAYWNLHRHEHNRKLCIQLIEEILDLSRDLDGYVRRYDGETAKSGRDSPLLRKAIGRVYLKRKQYEQAISNLRAAQELQPNDKETSDALIAAYDALGRPADGTAELLARLDFDRRDLKQYERLVERLKGDEALKERAATSLVEEGATEAENHQALANLRQTEDRWAEAAAEWNEVAELRRLEPTGLLGLANAQIRLKQWDDARRTIARLESTKWDERAVNIRYEVMTLRNKLPK